jgi:tetratricopeptide (TPR) repeat protein
MRVTTARWASGVMAAALTAVAAAARSAPVGSPEALARQAAPTERDRLDREARRLLDEGKLAEAIAAAEAVLALDRRATGGDDEKADATLELLAALHGASGDWDAARRDRREVLAMRSRLLGADHWRAVDARLALADVDLLQALDARQLGLFAAAGRALQAGDELYRRGDHAGAARLLARASVLYKQVLGGGHRETAVAMNNLAMALEPLGNPEEARRLLERSLEIEVGSLGERHPRTAATLLNLAMLRQRQGDLTGARPLMERAAAAYAGSLGERSPEYALCLNNQAELLRQLGEFAAARPLLERSVDLFAAGRGQRHPDYATALGNLASLLQEQGEYSGALPLAERALALRKEALGEQHPDYVKSLINLAVLHQERGDLAAARPLLEQARELAGRRPAADGPAFAATLNSLGALLYAQGDLAAARPLLERAVDIRRRGAGAHPPDDAAALGNLALVLQAQGDTTQARQVAERALVSARALHGEHHSAVARCLNNLAVLLWEQGDLAGALRRFEQALPIQEKILGRLHPAYAVSLENLAVLRQARGDLAGAQELLDDSLALTVRARGERHPEYITGLTNRAVLRWQRGDGDGARGDIGRAMELAEALGSEALPALSEREQLALMAISWRVLSAALSPPLASGDAREQYRHVLAWKGVATAAVRARLESNFPAARDRAARLAEVRARLNDLCNTRVPDDRAEAQARAIDEALRLRGSLERELAAAVGWDARPPAPERIAALLSEEDALVDVIRYGHLAPVDPEGNGVRAELRYSAFIVRRGRPPRRVDLGPADPLGEALAGWLGRVREGRDDEELGREVAQRAWDPLVPHLAGVRRVLVAPDGDFGFLPWGALPGPEPGSRLLRAYHFGTVVSARQLAGLAGPGRAPETAGLLAVGGVDYDRAEGVPRPTIGAASGPAPGYAALPGTGPEAEAIVALFRDAHPGAPAEVVSGPRASKDRLRVAMAGRRYLHLATHGYFAPPAPRTAPGSRDDASAWGVRPPDAIGLYPALRSGLVWAGINHPPIAPGTGLVERGAALMTAEEVGGLDLSACSLAVLSACETGLGRIAGGEGILGLQRAFGQAGCRTVVASLWKVDDDATRALMTRFYANLWDKGLPPLEALSRAQLSILDDPDYGAGGNPQLWAAWTLSGDPGGRPRPAGATPGASEP